MFRKTADMVHKNEIELARIGSIVKEQRMTSYFHKMSEATDKLDLISVRVLAIEENTIKKKEFSLALGENERLVSNLTFLINQKTREDN